MPPPARSRQAPCGAENLKNLAMPVKTRDGLTLLALLVAVLLLGMTAAMIYSALNVGITFSGKGEKRIHALEQKHGFLELLHGQIKSAFYDVRQKKNLIRADGELLTIVTRQPFLYRDNTLVLALYRYDAASQAMYYAEKRDFYNIEYGDDYLPDFDEMRPLLKMEVDVQFAIDEDSGIVTISLGETEHAFLPRAYPKK